MTLSAVKTMTTSGLKRSVLMLAGLMLALALAAPFDAALAGSPAFEQAKRDCLIGEGVDGMVHVKENISPELRKEIIELNARRTAAYADIAIRNQATVDITAEITGSKLIQQTPRGQCYRDKTGRWVTK